MRITAKYNIGDTVTIDGASHKIIAIHLYESADKHTERYYLGDGLWITLNKGTVVAKLEEADDERAL